LSGQVSKTCRGLDADPDVKPAALSSRSVLKRRLPHRLPKFLSCPPWTTGWSVRTDIRSMPMGTDSHDSSSQLPFFSSFFFFFQPAPVSLGAVGRHSRAMRRSQANSTGAIYPPAVKQRGDMTVLFSFLAAQGIYLYRRQTTGHFQPFPTSSSPL
jgi:hypothetical protein